MVVFESLPFLSSLKGQENSICISCNQLTVRGLLKVPSTTQHEGLNNWAQTSKGRL